MTVRRLVYPDYDAHVFVGGDIRIRFQVPSSKLGPVDIVLVAGDAEALMLQLDKALIKSDELLAKEGGSASVAPGETGQTP